MQKMTNQDWENHIENNEGRTCLIVTSTESGWDCIVGVYEDVPALLNSYNNLEAENPAESLEEYKEANPEYCFFHKSIEVKV